MLLVIWWLVCWFGFEVASQASSGTKGRNGHAELNLNPSQAKACSPTGLAAQKHQPHHPGSMSPSDRSWTLGYRSREFILNQCFQRYFCNLGAAPLAKGLHLSPLTLNQFRVSRSVNGANSPSPNFMLNLLSSLGNSSCLLAIYNVEKSIAHSNQRGKQ